jgi:hypothetical protein
MPPSGLIRLPLNDVGRIIDKDDHGVSGRVNLPRGHLNVVGVPIL